MNHPKNKEMVQEKRSLPRKHLVSSLQVYDNSTGQEIGRLVDLSTQGLMLISGEPVSSERQHRLRIRLSQGEFERNELIFNAICCWSKKEESSDLHTSGFRMDALSADLQRRIQTLMSNQGID